MSTRIMNGLFYAGLFIVIILVLFFVDFIISKTAIGRSRVYQNVKKSLSNIFIGKEK